MGRAVRVCAVPTPGGCAESGRVGCGVIDLQSAVNDAVCAGWLLCQVGARSMAVTAGLDDHVR